MYQKFLLLFGLLPSVAYGHDETLHPAGSLFDSVSPLLIGLIVSATAVVGGVVYMRTRSISYGVVVGLLVLATLTVSGYRGSMREATIDEMTTAVLAGVPMTVYKTPTCGCCGGYVDALKNAGAAVTVEVVDDAALQAFKQEYGIRDDQASCHTTVAEGYVIEGHVPLTAVAKLIIEKPTIAGITLPGMPIGTPGMPGRQSEPFVVTTLEGTHFWQSS
jgi:hypothetical protein